MTFDKTKYRFSLFCCILLLSLLTVSCSKNSYKADRPSYIEISSIDLTTNFATEGSNSHGITDAWVFVDDVSIGTYELPATFPLLEEGTHRITIFAGIKVNGISIDRGIYPFFKPYELSLDLITGTTSTLNPTVSYYSGIEFAWKEDFNLGHSMVKSGLSDTMFILMSIDTLPALGANSAVIFLDQNNSYFEARTSQKYFTPPQGFAVYLEISYKTTNVFSVGVYKNTVTGTEKVNPFLNIRANSAWNTMYIELTDYMKVHTDAISFEVYFSAALETGLSSSTIYIDNAKLIHYQ